MKQRYLNNTAFRRYLLHALGEMSLVIIGILIALQIDNWNNNRLQQEALNSYLHTIAINVRSDLASIDDLRSERRRAYELAVRWFGFQPRDQSYRVRDVMLASQVQARASTLRYFNASTSGYEALKSSGVLDQMQGTDVEKLLFDYYDTVVRIARSEHDHNEISRALSLQVSANWPDGIAPWEMSSASVLTFDRIESLQPLFGKVLGETTMQHLLSMPAATGPLLREYDRLDRLGRAFLHLVDIDSATLDDVAIRILDGIYDPRDNVGQPDVITRGQVNWQAYTFINSDANDPRVSYEASLLEPRSPFDSNSVQHIDDALHIKYHGGVAWAGIWFAAGTSPADRLSPDYSMYSKLLLELKGDVGGEKIIVNMEDRDDPADGTSTRYELQLSENWQTYEIDLAEFRTADLSILSIPLGFVFFEEPVSFSIRTARFTSDE